VFLVFVWVSFCGSVGVCVLFEILKHIKSSQEERQDGEGEKRLCDEYKREKDAHETKKEEKGYCNF